MVIKLILLMVISLIDQIGSTGDPNDLLEINHIDSQTQGKEKSNYTKVHAKKLYLVDSTIRII